MHKSSFWALVDLLYARGDATDYWHQNNEGRPSHSKEHQLATALYIMGSDPDSTGQRARIQLKYQLWSNKKLSLANNQASIKNQHGKCQMAFDHG